MWEYARSLAETRPGWYVARRSVRCRQKMRIAPTDHHTASGADPKQLWVSTRAVDEKMETICCAATTRMLDLPDRRRTAKDGAGRIECGSVAWQARILRGASPGPPRLPKRSMKHVQHVQRGRSRQWILVVNRRTMLSKGGLRRRALQHTSRSCQRAAVPATGAMAFSPWPTVAPAAAKDRLLPYAVFRSFAFPLQSGKRTQLRNGP